MLTSQSDELELRNRDVEREVDRLRDRKRRLDDSKKESAKCAHTRAYSSQCGEI